MSYKQELTVYSVGERMPAHRWSVCVYARAEPGQWGWASAWYDPSVGYWRNYWHKLEVTHWHETPGPPPGPHEVCGRCGGHGEHGSVSRPGIRQRCDTCKGEGSTPIGGGSRELV